MKDHDCEDDIPWMYRNGRGCRECEEIHIQHSLDHLQAKITVLESALIQSNHMINFLHNCNTNKIYRYDYPEQTKALLSLIKSLVDIPESCVHSGGHPECGSCIDREEKYAKLEAAKKLLGI